MNIPEFVQRFDDAHHTMKEQDIERDWGNGIRTRQDTYVVAAQAMPDGSTRWLTITGIRARAGYVVIETREMP